jgi:hypothetical protein
MYERAMHTWRRARGVTPVTLIIRAPKHIQLIPRRREAVTPSGRGRAAADGSGEVCPGPGDGVVHVQVVEVIAYAGSSAERQVGYRAGQLVHHVTDARRSHAKSLCSSVLSCMGAIRQMADGTNRVLIDCHMPIHSSLLRTDALGQSNSEIEPITWGLTRSAFGWNSAAALSESRKDD